MKKLLLALTLLMSLGQFSYATSSSTGNWRWRNDDGSETTASWKDEENTPFELTDTAETFRLRIEVGYSKDDTPYNYYLEYTDDVNTGNWNRITTNRNSNAFAIAGTSDHLIDGSPTTEQLTDNPGFENYVFYPGLIWVNSDSKPSIPVKETKQEFEIALKATNNILEGKTYTFRLNSDGPHFGFNSAYLTTPVTLPVKLMSFSVNKNVDGAVITWSTAMEENNDFFEIERSIEGKDWKVIGKIPAIGFASDYSYQDQSPAAGMNYYRLKQYDKDGTANNLGIKSISFSLAKAAVSVFPNPVTEKMNLLLTDYKGKFIHAHLLTIDGKLINGKTLAVNGGQAEFILENKPAKGIYILKISGDGLNYHQKIEVN